ncbi:MAG TPA: glycoside hydrolase family 3 C-terminal domain-containing protein [Chthoniobacterales bacterium]|jgi:beta-glucosidase|nr:glycoside hydrolase family 3 C-terminal domain-containing protein [Chthoniobacterales bacterium]
MILTENSLTQRSADYPAKARALVVEMTLEEKALLLSGDGWWHTHPIDRLQIPALSIFDGPHGLRKVEGAGLPTSAPATCFPTASALASSWDTELIWQIGVALAEECQAHDVQVLLGPGVNMKRSPLAGRNFEYFSEDPLLAGKMAAAYILGVQSQGVGTSLKHYAANNQEFERMATSSNLDERTLHELYLLAFEIAVKEAQPWSVMAAYNPVNHVYATENSFLLRDILRAHWGFEGFVVSDWGAVHDGVAGVNAGLSLEMPGSGDYRRNKIIEAVRAGRLSPAKLDEVVVPLLTVILRAKGLKRPGASFDAGDHDALARRAAGESLVLLKNAGDLLPLDFRRTKRIALIGAFAKTPRYQGAGSSQVNPTRISTAYDELLRLADKNTVVRYAAGYTKEGATTEDLIEEARQQAKAAEVAVVFAGLPDSYECEGFDRSSLEMPAAHNRLIAAVSAAQPNVAVVLMNGSAVTMPWANKVRAILEVWLGGQAGGGAIADAITGRVNPSGKLAETFPARLEDTPSYPDFPARNKEANYGEGIFIGYRYYGTRKITPLFPFGFGLSYTTFAYTGLRVNATAIKETDAVMVEVKVKNSGPVAGQEVVQLYVHEQRPKVVRPERELKAFAKVALQVGEERAVSFQLTKRDFAYYDTSRHDWIVNPGKFDILVGSSSQDLPLRQTIEVEVSKQDYAALTRDSLLKEFKNHPKGKAFYPQLVEAFGLGNPDEADMAVRAFLDDMPVYKVCAFSEGKFAEERLEDILKQVR